MYELDEDGNRIRDADGKFVFNAVPTTDWGSPETLEHWREAWAELCNAKFAEKGLDVRIDHRSYERQGVDLLPTIHAVSYTHLDVYKRQGRDYLKVGQIMEILRQRGVRLIAINDGVDSARGDDDCLLYTSRCV